MNIQGMNLKQAVEIVGSQLGEASKVPGFSFGLPAKACITGAKLHNIPDTICKSCYAFRGNYTFPHVAEALNRRLIGITHPQWVEAMVFLINSKINSHKLKKNSTIHKVVPRYFRFHDSGDLQSLEHLENIAEVARQTPSIKYWLPTREYSIVKNWYAQGGSKPSNLVIRLSAHIVNGPHPTKLARSMGVNTSGVHRKHTKPSEGIKECHANLRNNFCGKCRACWDPKVESVSYKLH